MNSVDRIATAEAFATVAHEGQVRKSSGVPYVTHPLRVKDQARKFFLGVEAEIAALLHDVIEDCDISFNEIRDSFGIEVARMVWGLTNHEARNGGPDDTMNRAARKRADCLWLADQPAVVRNLKLLDCIDNMRDRPSDDGFMDILLQELMQLRWAMAVKDDPLNEEIANEFDLTWAEAMLARAQS